MSILLLIASHLFRLSVLLLSNLTNLRVFVVLAVETPAATGHGNVQLVPMRVVCKDFRILNLQLPSESVAEALFESIAALAFVMRRQDLPIYVEDSQTTWLPVLDAEFASMCIPPATWRRCDANADYALCASYPNSVYVPASISDAELASVARYRR